MTDIPFMARFPSKKDIPSLQDELLFQCGLQTYIGTLPAKAIQFSDASNVPPEDGKAFDILHP